MTNGSLMKIKSIAECSSWCILQFFWPALSDYLIALEKSFSAFESGSFTQVLLYVTPDPSINMKRDSGQSMYVF